jgi:hypothetical protein
MAKKLYDKKMINSKPAIILSIVLLAITGFLSAVVTQQMKRKYKKTVSFELERIENSKPELLTEEDIISLPEIVKKYLRYTGLIGKEKIFNFRAEFKGGMRFKPGEEYMPLKSVQYNFMDKHSRLFYIVVKIKGIPAIGIHIYQNAKAIFKVKILGLFTVVDASGPKMDQGESVTVLNDMVLLAPGTLADNKITWEVIDSLSVRAIFSNDKIKIAATLLFNEEGKLVNFMSNDRYETNGKEYKNYPWETPVIAYKEVNGHRLPSKAKLIYKHPEGDYCYAEFELIDLEYNCDVFK